jgi:predicted acyl esterase
VAPDGSAQGLVTRGTYRSLDGPGPALHARFQIAPQSYRFPAGHKLKVEVAANDFPYYQQDNLPGVVQVSRLELTLPIHQEASLAAAKRPSVLAVSASAPNASLPATGGTGHTAFALGLLALGFLGVSAKGRASAR